MGKTLHLSSFPSHKSAVTVKTFLENYTGKGTIYALEVLKCKNGKGAYAKFQFTRNEKTKHIISMAKQKCLNYGPHRKPLQAYANDMDIVKQTDIVRLTFDHCMEQKLHLTHEGNGVMALSESQKEKGEGRQMEMIEMELPLFMTGAPRIYECHINSQSYFKEIPDDQWVRATDLSPSHSIGNLLHHIWKFRTFLEISAESKESVSKFNLEAGFTNTRNLDLVSIVGSPKGIELRTKHYSRFVPWFSMDVFPELDEEFFKLVEPEGTDVVLVEHALERLFHSTDYCHENRQGGSVSNTKRTPHLSNYPRDLLLPWMLDVYMFAGS
ncbi:LOW QUALITY PROTEIN: hypothetical protein RJ639_047784 [Escallonia herrerae]|uniref:Uncharacterized protein n=1 Tax=Escallonia herrerae TaxID=1293975 RepID=A0AA88W865_9ASTE|nr:LOW QUALITY PROTEIN: hypothetical protein RJ639_047784 [Escallonia herrerae]